MAKPVKWTYQQVVYKYTSIFERHAAPGIYNLQGSREESGATDF